jgi:hypothetical protein
MSQYRHQWRDAWYNEVNGQPKFLLMLLFEYLREKTYCYPTQAQLAEHMGCTTRTVRTVISRLVSMGWITAIKSGRNSTYHIAYPGQTPETISGIGLTERGYSRMNTGKKEPKYRNSVPPKQEQDIKQSGRPPRSPAKGERRPPDYVDLLWNAMSAEDKKIAWLSYQSAMKKKDASKESLEGITGPG